MRRCPLYTVSPGAAEVKKLRSADVILVIISRRLVMLS